jgi:hypothetical protein
MKLRDNAHTKEREREKSSLENVSRDRSFMKHTKERSVVPVGKFFGWRLNDERWLTAHFVFHGWTATEKKAQFLLRQDAGLPKVGTSRINLIIKIKISIERTDSIIMIFGPMTYVITMQSCQLFQMRKTAGLTQQ